MVRDSLHIAILQYDIVWEDKGANQKKLENFFSEIPGDTDVIVLPEMFATGFSMETARQYETMDGEVVSWMQKKSELRGSVICGSLIIKENNNFYNRFCWVDSKTVLVYNKRHLFSMGDEDKNFMAGEKNMIIEHKGWKIKPQICYDLRFPVWARNTEGYDVLLNVANWPAARKGVWDVLLQARAIENQCYVLGCNRVGVDEPGIHYTGGSVGISAKGKKLGELDDCEGVLNLILDYQELDGFREKFDSLKDRDQFYIKN